MTDEQIRANPPKTDPPETQLHTPTNDAKRITEMGARRGDLYSIFRESPSSRLPEQDTNPSNIVKNN